MLPAMLPKEPALGREREAQRAPHGGPGKDAEHGSTSEKKLQKCSPGRGGGAGRGGWGGVG